MLEKFQWSARDIMHGIKMTKSSDEECLLYLYKLIGKAEQLYQDIEQFLEFYASHFPGDYRREEEEYNKILLELAKIIEE